MYQLGFTKEQFKYIKGLQGSLTVATCGVRGRMRKGHLLAAELEAHQKPEAGSPLQSPVQVRTGGWSKAGQSAASLNAPRRKETTGLELLKRSKQGRFLLVSPFIASRVQAGS